MHKQYHQIKFVIHRKNEPGPLRQQSINKSASGEHPTCVIAAATGVIHPAQKQN
ncbi:hypothetical protein ACDT65_004489 [Salmonella enterica subsp. enterica]|nr:hypothetical protein [Salmonella enterica subsp. enterica serovar Paratyphi B]